MQNISHEQEKKISDATYESVQLDNVPESERYATAISQQASIDDGYKLAWTLLQLPNDKKIYLADELQEKIEDGYQLSQVLGNLPIDKRAFFLDWRQRTRLSLGMHVASLWRVHQLILSPG